MSPRFVEVSRHADVSMRDAERHQLKTSNTVAIYRFDGDLYFANTGYLEGKLLNAIAHKPNLTVMVLDGENRFFRERTQAIKDAKRQWGDAIDIEPLLNYMPAEASVIKPIQAVSGAETEPNTKPLIAWG